MRSIVIGLVAAILSTAATAAPVYVHGYTTKSGTYVAPHYRSAPDSNPYNNWSTSGNVNPYTGQVGTRNPYSGYGSSNSTAPATSSGCLYCAPTTQPPTSTDDDGSPY